MSKKNNSRLGTGLEALFGEERAESEQQDNAPKTLPVEKIEPRKNQPRQNFDEEALESLAESIRQYGVIQPVTVRKLESGYYEIVAGERRWRAARIAGQKEVPVNIIEADDQTTAELALIENLHRQNLNPVEEALGYQALMEEFGLTQEEVSEKMGRARPTVTNALRILSLPAPVLQLVSEGSLTAGHARALLAIENPKEQMVLAEEIVAKGSSVRETERAVNRYKKTKERKSKAPEKPLVDYVAEESENLSKAFSRKCKIIEGRKVGRIELEYYGAEDRENLLHALYKAAQQEKQIPRKEKEIEE
jgi:ParB family chromosome partitioning protein